MKKMISIVMVCLMLTGILCACGSSNGAGSAINVISREEGSGTRGAFVELLGVVDANENDAIADSAEITNSTSVMLTTVAGDSAAIGYVSLGSLSEDVKALKVDGVAPTVENIVSGDYKIWRPFNIVYTEGSLSELANDFLTYMLSADGQAVITDGGYISASDAGSYTPAGLSGKITLAGSTSVAPIMEKLADAYKALNPDVTIEIQQSGSSAGISSAIEGVCDFGMSSRELKPEEASKLSVVCIATDGIAVIVNKQNTVDDLSADTIKAIFLGEITDWTTAAE